MATTTHDHLQHTQGRRRASDDNHFLGPNDKIGEGDSRLALNVLPPDLAETAFENLRKEVKWNTMFHRGVSSKVPYCTQSTNSPSGGEVPRLVAVEGEVSPDGRWVIIERLCSRF